MPALQWVLEIYDDLLVEMLPEPLHCFIVGRYMNLEGRNPISVPFIPLDLCRSAQSIARRTPDIRAVGKVCLGKLVGVKASESARE